MSARFFLTRTCLQRQRLCVPLQSVLGEHRLRGTVYMRTRLATCSLESPMTYGSTMRCAAQSHVLITEYAPVYSDVKVYAPMPYAAGLYSFYGVRTLGVLPVFPMPYGAVRGAVQHTCAGTFVGACNMLHRGHLAVGELTSLCMFPK